LALIDTAWAQATADQPDRIETVVVTAQKRVETVQNTPLAISVLSGNTLRQQGDNNILALANSLANVNINILQNSVHINIRGIGLTTITPVSEASVAFHIDGVYVSQPESQSDTLFDIERIEVARGPQGTLYGRNATGGAVNVITADPTDTLQGYAQLTLGNYGTVVTEGAVSGPIADGISGRIAFQTSNHDGYGFQGLPDRPTPFDNLNTRAVRGKLKFDFGNNVTTILSADYFHQDDASGILTFIGESANGMAPVLTHFAGGTFSPNPRDLYGDLPSGTRKDDWGVAATTVWADSEAFNLTSVTGYRQNRYNIQEDYDETPIDGAKYFSGTRSNQFSEELRADGRIGSFSYVAGAYYLKENLNYHAISTRNLLFFGGGNVPVQGQYQTGELATEAKALFAQIGYEITDNFGIDLGARYNDETAVKTNEELANDNVTPYNTSVPPHFTTIIPYATVTNTAVTPKGTLRYKPTDDTLLYATYSEGFKSGSFVLGTGGPAVKPEKLKDIEGGFKSDWFDKRLQLDFAVFHYNYTNLQVQRSLPGGNHITDNAGKAQMDGVEVSIIALPVDDLRVDLNIGYNDSKYILYSAPDTTRPALGIIDLAGNELVEDPRYKINLGVQYTWHPNWGDVTLRGESQFVDRTYFTPFNAVQFSQAPYAKLDAYLNYESPNGNWFGGLYIKNVTNQTILSAATTASANVGAYVQGLLEPPRTFGVRAGINF
jgi:iron complex outermembrane receptor protein